MYCVGSKKGPKAGGRGSFLKQFEPAQNFILKKRTNGGGMFSHF